MQNTVAHTPVQLRPERSEAFKLVKLPLDIEAQLKAPYAESYEYVEELNNFSDTYIDYDGGEYEDGDEYVLDRVLRLSRSDDYYEDGIAF